MISSVTVVLSLYENKNVVRKTDYLLYILHILNYSIIIFYSILDPIVYNEESKGFRFIQAFVHVMKQNAHKKHLLEMMTIVSAYNVN